MTYQRREFPEGRSRIDEIEYEIARNIHGRYCVPRSSSYTYTSKTILDGNVHEPGTIEFIINNHRNLDVVHAGAGFGDFLPALSKNCQGKIWTFEPNRENYLCSKKTIELNNLRNVNLFNIGLGASRDEKLLKVAENDLALGPRSEIVDEISSVSTLQECQILPLDEIVTDRNVSIIHLDVEGYEFCVLDGARRTIERSRPLIILEIDQRALKYNEYMRSLGYTPIKQLVYEMTEMVFVNAVYAQSGGT